MSSDLPEEREPVRVVRPAGRQGSNDGGSKKRTAAEKLARRLAALPAGRYEIVLTVGDDGVPADWSVRWFGKVETP